MSEKYSKLLMSCWGKNWKSFKRCLTLQVVLTRPNIQNQRNLHSEKTKQTFLTLKIMPKHSNCETLKIRSPCLPNLLHARK